MARFVARCRSLLQVKSKTLPLDTRCYAISQEDYDVKPIAIIAALLALVGCESEAETQARTAQREYRDKLIVARVCRDGTYIWQGPDGKRYVIGFAHSAYVQPDIPLKDVCE